jgi:hypothetical protein
VDGGDRGVTFFGMNTGAAIDEAEREPAEVDPLASFDGLLGGCEFDEQRN